MQNSPRPLMMYHLHSFLFSTIIGYQGKIRVLVLVLLILLNLLYFSNSIILHSGMFLLSKFFAQIQTRCLDNCLTMSALKAGTPHPMQIICSPTSYPWLYRVVLLRPITCSGKYVVSGTYLCLVLPQLPILSDQNLIHPIPLDGFMHFCFNPDIV